MPFGDDDLEPDGPVRVAPSAPSELMWVLLYLTHTKRVGLDQPAAGLAERHAGLAARARAFWAGQLAPATEVLVVAERVGTLLDADLDVFLERLDATCRAGGPESTLRSETPEEREHVNARLERLRVDGTRRREFVDLMGDVWAAVRADWDRDGRPAVVAACRALEGRLAAGSDLRALLPAGHIAAKAPWEAMITEALGRGQVVLSPCWYIGGRGHLVELSGLVHVGVAIAVPDEVERLRAQAELVAGRIKVLSDPTRVAILSQLAVEPLSVTDLAVRFGLSQPTVSNHVRLLRDANLLEARKDGGRTAYTATRARVERLLDDAGSLLLAGCPT